MSKSRKLTEDEQTLVAAAHDKALTLYRGEQVPHRSCGIALAETFDLATQPYQALRRGGIMGCGRCGAVRAGEHILGELLGDPDPAGPVTDELQAAVRWYQAEVDERIDKGASADLVCNHLTEPFGDFHGQERKEFCTGVAARAAALTAEALIRFSPKRPKLVISPIAKKDANTGAEAGTDIGDREEGT